MKNKFMHTLNGKPAFYVEGEQIVYACGCVDRLEDSLYTIRKQQRLSIKLRKSNQYDVDSMRYDYTRIKLTDESQ